ALRRRLPRRCVRGERVPDLPRHTRSLTRALGVTSRKTHKHGRSSHKKADKSMICSFSLPRSSKEYSQPGGWDKVCLFASVCVCVCVSVRACLWVCVCVESSCGKQSSPVLCYPSHQSGYMR